MKKFIELFNLIKEKTEAKMMSEDLIYSKTAFLKWLFELIEQTESDELDTVNEEYKALDVSIDGFFSDVDEDDMIIIVSDYYDSPTPDFEISEDRYYRIITKLTNFFQIVFERKYHKFGETSLTYEISDNISNSGKDIIVNYYTNLKVPDNLQNESTIDVKGRSILVRFIDIMDIEENLENHDESINIEFNDLIKGGLEAIKVASSKDFDVYLFVLPGYLLAKLYEKHGLSLLDSNVRSYLKKTQKVNKGIWQTINEAPSEFLAYNNGLATVAVNASIKPLKDNYCKIISLSDWQIVNGGQTTATVYEALVDKLELRDVLVPVKLTVIKNIDNNFDLVQSISLYANTQTAINKSDLSSNEPYYIDLDRISRKVTWRGEFHWFFERNRGQYLAHKRRSKNPKKFERENPKKYKFTKTDIAKSIVSWQSMPHIVALGREKNFVFFNDHVRNQMIKVDEKYYKNIVGAVILFREVDKIVRKQKLEFKANVVSYTIAKLSYDLNKQLDLSSFWDNQELPQELIEAIYRMTIKVRDKLIDSPPNYKNIPMWARKAECWNSIKDLDIMPISYLKSLRQVDFFPVNKAQIFIDDEKNFNKESTWTKVLLWNSVNNIFSNKQLGLIRRIESNIRFQKSFTVRLKKQAKDLFLLAAKEGYNY